MTEEGTEKSQDREEEPSPGQPQYVDPSITSAKDAQANSGCLSDARGCLTVISEIGGVIAELAAGFFGHG